MKRSLLLFALALLPLGAIAASPKPLGVDVSRAYPYSLIGQLTFFSGDRAYLGTGTVVHPYGILTAGHNLYDPSGGWSTDLVFKRSRYNNTSLSVRYASRSYVFAGYQASVQTYGVDDVRSFARDSAALVFRSQPAGGGYLGLTTDRTLLTGKARKVALGYGAEEHSGDQLLAVVTTPFRAIYSGFFESYDTKIESGMSGGPVIVTLPNGSRAVAGVVVAGSDRPVTGGIRIVNSTTVDFIRRYLGPTAK